METSKSINNDIENRMLATERRLVHMASLLSESEAENARLTQLANVLKEEIRSYQRSEERIKHIENLEYVKNVILKVHIMYFSKTFFEKNCLKVYVSLKHQELIINYHLD